MCLSKEILLSRTQKDVKLNITTKEESCDP